jgi:photosystem II stability/assembly factor-like uncharacterized protein
MSALAVAGVLAASLSPAAHAQKTAKPRSIAAKPAASAAAAEPRSGDAAGLEPGRINRLAFNPQAPATMYAGSSSGGVYHSTNGGDSWMLASNGITDPQIEGLAVLPSNPSVLVACTPSGVFRTANAGQEWTHVLSLERELPPAEAPNELYEIQKSPVRYDALSKAFYAAPWGAGLYKSTDGGVTWTQIFGQDIRAAKDKSIMDMDFASEGGGTIYITTLGGLKKYQKSAWSDDGKEIVSPKTRKRLNPVCVRVAPSDPKRMYVTASNLEGSPLESSVWRRDAPGGPFVLACGTSKVWPSWSVHQCLAVDPRDPNRIFAGGVTLTQSTDGGKTWVEAPRDVFKCSDSNICGVDYRDIAYDPTGQLFYGAHDQGIFKYDFRTKATKAAEKGLAVNQFYDLDIGPGGTLYGGTQDTGAYSRRSGAGWVQLETAGSGDVLGMMADPQDDTKVFIRTNAEPMLLGTKYGTAHTQSAGGLLASAFWNHQMAYIPQSHELYVGTEFKGVFKSHDGGKTFAPSNNGIASLNVRCLAAMPGTPKELFVGSLKDGVFRTDDGGEKWQKVPSFPPAAAPLVFKGVAGGTVYAGTSDGVYVSKDKGGAWTPMSHGLPARKVVSDLIVDPASPNTLYAGLGFYDYDGLYGGGVYASRDGGANWTALDAAKLKYLSVVSVRLDPKDASKIWVATYGSGVLSIPKGK